MTEMSRPAADFRIFTGILRAARDGDGRRRVFGVASSTTRDLHGDVMELSAIEDMEKAANQNLTIFLNHSYNVPEDVGGSVSGARISRRGADHDGGANYDLDIEVLMNDTNPRAVQTFDAINAGTKLGISIGAMIPDGGAAIDRKTGRYSIKHVDLLEASFVGIPANPRSWVDYAVKSLRAREVPESDLVTVEDGAVVHHNRVSEDGSEVTIAAETFERLIDVAKERNDLLAEDVVEVDTEKAKVTVETPFANITVDTDSTSDGAGSSSQAASGSEPGNGDGLLDETADGDTARLGDTVTNSVQDTVTYSSGNATTFDVIPGTDVSTSTNVLWTMQPDLERTIDLLTKTTGELVDARKEIADLVTKMAGVERERDEAIAQRDRVLETTTKTLERISSIPLSRKTHFVEATSEFTERMKGIYPEGFLKIMEERTHG